MIAALVCDSILVSLYIVTILRMAIRTKLHLNMFTCFLLLVADVCFCMEQVAQYNIFKDATWTGQSTSVRWETTLNVLNGVYNSTFCLAHWIFSMMYWSSAVRLPYVYKGNTPPSYTRILI